MEKKNEGLMMQKIAQAMGGDVKCCDMLRWLKLWWCLPLRGCNTLGGAVPWMKKGQALISTLANNHDEIGPYAQSPSYASGFLTI